MPRKAGLFRGVPVQGVSTICAGSDGWNKAGGPRMGQMEYAQRGKARRDLLLTDHTTFAASRGSAEIQKLGTKEAGSRGVGAE
jgi:hypothetical protein